MSRARGPLPVYVGHTRFFVKQDDVGLAYRQIRAENAHLVIGAIALQNGGYGKRLILEIVTLCAHPAISRA